MPLLTNFQRKYPDSPYLHQVYYQLGIFQNSLERYKEAYLAFSTAVETPEGKNDRKTHLYYIESCENGGFPNAQLDAIHTYLKHFPNAPDRMSKQIDIGSLYRDMGYNDIAIAHLKSILPKANPGEQIEIQFAISENYYEQKNYTLAIVEYLKLIKYGRPSSFYESELIATAKWYTGQSFKEIGKYENALEYVEEVLKTFSATDPRHQEARREKELILDLMKIKK